MCYFSDSNKRKELKGKLTTEDMTNMARIFFPKAVQLVVGCGAEPTMNREFMELLKLAKSYRIPNTSIVTNGLLLRDSHLQQLIELGIDEIILSAHGLQAENYEHFMVNGKFKQFTHLLDKINQLKHNFNSTKPKVRINFTVNEVNIDDLTLFSSFADTFNFDTFQVRPINDIGGKYTKKLDDKNTTKYNKIINMLQKECNTRNILLLANTTDITYQVKNRDTYILESIYTYLSPKTENQLQLDFSKHSLRQFKKRIKWNRNLLKGMVKNSAKDPNSDSLLKYDAI
jgi:MoaA/NifB/PqqE/SkfB family radical SAM enzyme